MPARYRLVLAVPAVPAGTEFDVTNGTDTQEGEVRRRELRSTTTGPEKAEVSSGVPLENAATHPGSDPARLSKRPWSPSSKSSTWTTYSVGFLAFVGLS